MKTPTTEDLRIRATKLQVCAQGTASLFQRIWPPKMCLLPESSQKKKKRAHTCYGLCINFFKDVFIYLWPCLGLLHLQRVRAAL